MYCGDGFLVHPAASATVINAVLRPFRSKVVIISPVDIIENESVEHLCRINRSRRVESLLEILML